MTSKFYGLFVTYADQPEHWEVIPLKGETFDDADSDSRDIEMSNTRVDSCLWIDDLANFKSLRRALDLLTSTKEDED